MYEEEQQLIDAPVLDRKEIDVLVAVVVSFGGCGDVWEIGANSPVLFQGVYVYCTDFQIPTRAWWNGWRRLAGSIQARFQLIE